MRPNFALKAIALGIGVVISLASIPAQSEEYKLGGMYTYYYHDGRYADWGDFALQAAHLAIEDINKSGMLGDDKLSMPDDLVKDYHCWPDGVGEMTKSLIDKGAIAITGCDCSSPATLIAQSSAKYKIPALSYGSNSSNLSSIKDFPFVYRNVTPSSAYEGYLLDVAKEYGVKKIAFFYTTDDWGTGAAIEILKKAQELGIEIAASFGYSRNTPVEVVTKNMMLVKDAGIRTVLVTAPTPDTVITFKALNALDINNKLDLILASEMVSTDEKPDAINGAKGYIAPMTRVALNDKVLAFHKRFEGIVGKKIDPNSKAFFYSLLSYDHIWAVGEAIKLAKADEVTKINGETLMKYLRKVNFDGLTGRNNLKAGTNDRERMSVEMMNCQGYYEDGKTVKFVPVGNVDSVTNKLTINKEIVKLPGQIK